jgi:hypothetical protein
MFGIVNKAIEHLVITNFGEDKWDTVKKISGVEHDFFISNEPYDDQVTFKLAQAIAQEMNMSLEDVFISFGQWWVVKTTQDKYGDLMQSGGNNLRDFLLNLPLFHNRVMLLYPKLTPPEFRISHLTDSSLHLHYISQRQGLKAFVIGLIQGLGIIFKTQISIEHIESGHEGQAYEIFKLSW